MVVKRILNEDDIRSLLAAYFDAFPNDVRIKHRRFNAGEFTDSDDIVEIEVVTPCEDVLKGVVNA